MPDIHVLMPFIVIGSIYGLIIGIAVGIWFCASILVKKNIAFEEKKTDFSYSSRGVEIFNRNMTDEFTTAVSGRGGQSLSSLTNADDENLAYFNRNTDLDYKPVKKKLDLDKVNKRPVNRRKYFGNVRTGSVREGIEAASKSKAKVASDIKAAEEESEMEKTPAGDG